MMLVKCQPGAWVLNKWRLVIFIHSFTPSIISPDYFESYSVLGHVPGIRERGKNFLSPSVACGLLADRQVLMDTQDWNVSCKGSTRWGLSSRLGKASGPVKKIQATRSV